MPYFPFICKQIKRKNDRPHSLNNQRAITFVRKCLYSEQVLSLVNSGIYPGVYGYNAEVPVIQQRFDPIKIYSNIYKPWRRNVAIFDLQRALRKKRSRRKFSYMPYKPVVVKPRNVVFDVPINRSATAKAMRGVMRVKFHKIDIETDERKAIRIKRKIRQIKHLRSLRIVKKRYAHSCMISREKQKIYIFDNKFANEFVSAGKVAQQECEYSMSNQYDQRLAMFGKATNLYWHVIDKMRRAKVRASCKVTTPIDSALKTLGLVYKNVPSKKEVVFVYNFEFSKEKNKFFKRRKNKWLKNWQEFDEEVENEPIQKILESESESEESDV